MNTKVIAFCKILRHCKENTIQIKVIIKAISLLSLFSASLPPPSYPLACFLPARPSKVWWFGTCAASETIAAISPLATLQLGRLCLGRPVPRYRLSASIHQKHTRISHSSMQCLAAEHGICHWHIRLWKKMLECQEPKIRLQPIARSLLFLSLSLSFETSAKGRRWSRTQWKWSLSNPKKAVCRNLDERCSKEGLDWRFSANIASQGDDWEIKTLRPWPWFKETTKKTHKLT